MGRFPLFIFLILFCNPKLFRYLKTDEKMAEEAFEKLMLPRVVSHVSMHSQSIV